MRKTIKKPLTERALELTIKRLKKIASSEEEMQAILDKSILKSWAGVFPLTEQDKVELNLEKQQVVEQYKEVMMTEEEYYKKMKGNTEKYE